MEQTPDLLIRLVMERAGISEQQATAAVDEMKAFIRQRIPPVTHAQFNRIFSGMTFEESVKSQMHEVGGELRERAEGLALDLKTAFEKAFGGGKKTP